MRPLCSFYATPGPEERAALGCVEDQGEGPLFFFVPVEGGAVRVGVCPRHCEYLKGLYGDHLGSAP